MHLLVRSRVLFKSLRIWEVSIGLMYQVCCLEVREKEKWKDIMKKDI